MPVIAQVQKTALATSSTTVTSFGVTYGTPATATNLLIAVAHTDQNTTTLTASGWTAVPLTNVARIYAVLYKIAVGGETGITVSTSPTSGNIRLGAFEYSSSVGWASSPLDVSTTVNSATGGVTSLATTTTGATAVADALALAMFGLAAGSGGSFSYTNSYDGTAGYNATDRVGAAFKILTSTSGGETTTASWTSSRASGAIHVVFKTGGGTNASPTPAAVSVVVTAPSSTRTATASVTTVRVAAGASIATPTITASATVTTVRVAANASVPSPSVSTPTSATVTTVRVAVTVSVPLATVTTTTSGVSTFAEAFTDVPAPTSGVRITSTAPERFVVQAFSPLQDGVWTWGVSKWGEGLWAGAGTWQDLSTRVTALSVNRGANSPLDAPSAGHMTFTLLNNDGDASPWTTTSGDFSEPTGASTFASWLRSGTLVRCGVLSGSTWQPIFTGLIQGLTENAVENTVATVDVAAVEYVQVLADYVGAGVEPVGADDNLDDRVARLLADANWQAGYSIDTDPIGTLTGDTFTAFQATTMAGSRIAELQLTADSVGMRVLTDGSGKLRITSQQPDDAVTAAFTFSNLLLGSRLPIVDASTYASTDRIVNAVNYSRVDGEPQQLADALSIQQYGIHAVNREDLLLTQDAVVQLLVHEIITLRAWDEVGVESIVLDLDQDPARLPATFALLFSSALTDRTPFRVRWFHPSNNQFVEVVLLEGYSFSYQPLAANVAPKWTATLSTSLRV